MPAGGDLFGLQASHEGLEQPGQFAGSLDRDFMIGVKEHQPSAGDCGDDGIAGLALYGRLQPQVLIVDILLPGIDGATLITSLRSHPQFAHVVERCLEIDPDCRWQSARDVKLELDWGGRSSPAAPMAAVR